MATWSQLKTPMGMSTASFTTRRVKIRQRSTQMAAKNSYLQRVRDQVDVEEQVNNSVWFRTRMGYDKVGHLKQTAQEVTQNAFANTDP